MTDLSKKKELASRALNVGRDRIVFNTNRLADIKEAITKQDIKDLNATGAILIKEIKGRKKIIRRKTRKRLGVRRKIIRRKKRSYMLLARKLRSHLLSLKNKKAISPENYRELRKGIKARAFSNLIQLKERIMEVKK